MPLRGDRQAARPRRRVARAAALVAALGAVAAFAAASAPLAGAGYIGQMPDAPGLSSGYLGGCEAYHGKREWTCYLVNLRRAVLAYRDPAHQLPNLDVRVRQTGGYLMANCHMMMHVVGRDYAHVHHVTLQTLQRYLPLSNDPGCSAGFGMGLVMGLSKQITEGGPAGAKKICNEAATRFRNYTCYHSLGHAYMRFYHGYLSFSLQMCRALGEQAPDCAQGVFHDYWLGLSGQDGARFAHGPRTARALCAKQHGVYVVACWFRYYLTLPPKRLPTSSNRIESLCTGLRGEQRFGCVASASVISNPDPQRQFAVCARLPTGDVVACLHGVGFQNVTDSQPARLALIGRCGTLAAGARTGCYQWLGTAMGVLTNGTFGRTGCPALKIGDARAACEQGVRLMSRPLVTFS